VCGIWHHCFIGDAKLWLSCQLMIQLGMWLFQHTVKSISNFLCYVSCSLSLPPLSFSHSIKNFIKHFQCMLCILSLSYYFLLTKLIKRILFSFFQSELKLAHICGEVEFKNVLRSKVPPSLNGWEGRRGKDNGRGYRAWEGPFLLQKTLVSPSVRLCVGEGAYLILK